MREQWNESTAVAKGLYDPRFEHDNCGIGAVVNIKGIKTHQTVENALKIVENLKHRAGKDADGKTGDGVGILLQISHKFFKKAVKPLGIELGDERDYGVGMFFFPQDELKNNQAKKMFEVIVEKEGMEFLGWREVPIHPDKLSDKARDCMPCIMQAFVKRPEDVEKGLDFDRKLYVARRVFEQSNDDSYVASLSSRTIVYKGMFLVEQLRQFFSDLQDPDYESAIATVHSRFSTNTNPSWERAHPNRFIVHNGEINTIRGNADKMLAREETMASGKLRGEFQKVLPVINTEGSDSAMLDNTLEFLVMSGMELPLAVMIMIPEPWANNAIMSQKKKDFYQYYATMMEPWDGPASILFSDGDMMGAVLDRNGLRPSRYYITDDDYLILSSEVGVLDIDSTKIVTKDRLRPGKMLLVDTIQGRVIDDDELKEKYAGKRPYGEWLDSNIVMLEDLKIPNERVPEYTKEERQRMQRAFGYTYESLKDSILPMAKNGIEGTAAMGTDTPLAALSGNREPLFNYFKQLFAQVTNPPIDSIREEVVTSTTVYIGAGGNLLEEKPQNCKVLRINNPILTNTDLMKIRDMKVEGFKVATISIVYYKNTSLEKAVDRLFIEADRAYRDGANILILSDREVDDNHVAIPSLLAVSALQQYLVKTKKRTSLSVILESGEPREVHHFATLLGFGASAINPYLAQFARDNKSLGQFRLDGIPPARRGVPQIEVTFDIDANGIVNVSAKDLGTGKEQHITITAGSNMSDDEIDKAVKEAAEFEAQDKKRKEAIDARNEAESFVFQTEDALKQVGEQVDAADKSAVEADIAAVKSLLDAHPEADKMTESDVAELKAAQEKLTESAQKVFAKMYEQAQAAQGAQGAAGPNPNMGGAAGAGPDMNAGSSQGADDDVIDADFKEV